MGSVKEYFSSLGTGIASLVKGLSVTGKEFITPKITERYPENRQEHQWPERFRAKLQFIYDAEGNHRCIACGTCERNCPNDTIQVITKMVDTPAGTKKKKLDRYIYDLGSCTFCQLCVTTCPTNAIEFNNDFEQAVFTRSKLVQQLNYLPEKEEPKPSPEEMARIQAERQAKIEAAKARVAAGNIQENAPAPNEAAASANDKMAAAIMAARKAVEAAATPEEKAAAQTKLDKLVAAAKAKAARDAAAANAQ